MKLLIVDDEPLAVRSVKNAIDWSRLGIEHIYEAYHAAGAKEIFATQQIDIMLCDIEMPKESGLQLLVWVREHYPQTASIFLTCHADFQYAQEAIKLGSLDYLLKPIPPDELEAAIEKAQQQLQAQQQLKQHSESWVKHHPLFIERFWLDVLHRHIPATAAAIQQAADERNIQLKVDKPVIMIKVDIHRWHKPLNLRDEKIMEYALANALHERLQELGKLYGMIAAERGHLIAILSEMSSNTAELSRQMSGYIENCRQFFYCDLSVYIGEPAAVYELPDMSVQLDQFIMNNVTRENEVLYLTEQHADTAAIVMPDLRIWRFMLQEGAGAKLLTEVEAFFVQLRHNRDANALMLHRLYQDFVQMVYAVLAEKGIAAHQLFGDQHSIELASRAAASVKNMGQWALHLIEKALSYAEEVKLSDSIVVKVKAYITKNLQEDLNRESIASHFYLHPDYMNRLFKKETGLSMTEFLVQERMTVAKELLLKTEMSITTIALHVGYSNTSHFAKLFKKQFGANPNEYRHSNG